MRSNHRRDVTKSLARGEIAEVDQTWSSLRVFVQAYRETMARVGATSYYLFPDEYFEELRVALGDHAHLWTVRSGSSIIAGAVLTECNGIVQYHLGGTLNHGLPSNPLKLLFSRAMTWFKHRGNTWLHLGGGLGGAEDSLMYFKRGFSPRTFPFHTWRLVLNARVYNELLERAGHQPDDDALAAAFFPAYRRLIQP
jgi:lipid II:glycine glycyltransferase (peptidoglycan interpeptide bridge formation enzyme)